MEIATIQNNGIVVKLSEEIQSRREAKLKSEAKIFRQVNPRASAITECNREMVLSITNWKDKPAPDIHLQARFNEGKEQERKVIRELIDLGFEVIEGQKPFELKDRKSRTILTGSIDGKILLDGKRIPFEIKSLNPNIYSQINEVNDFNRYEWVKRYPRQMQAYLYGNNEESGLFILTDCLGHIKTFPVFLDYEEMEVILKRCEYVMDCVENKTLPDYHKDYSVCRRCWALGRCCTPPLDFGEGTQVIDDPDMEFMLNRREELNNVVKEYKQIDKQVKDYFKEKPNCLVGNFHISGSWRERKECHIPASRYWQSKIEKVKE